MHRNIELDSEERGNVSVGRVGQPRPTEPNGGTGCPALPRLKFQCAKLVVAKTVWEETIACARQAVPFEACGLLAGGDGRVTKFYLMTNIDASPEHFSMKPEEQFAAVKDMRRTGLKMLAIWHSHPSSPPRMSAEDLRLAFTPDVAYVILSLAPDANPECRAFVINSGISQSVEVVIANE